MTDDLIGFGFSMLFFWKKIIPSVIPRPPPPEVNGLGCTCNFHTFLSSVALAKFYVCEMFLATLVPWHGALGVLDTKRVVQGSANPRSERWWADAGTLDPRVVCTYGLDTGRKAYRLYRVCVFI